MSADVGTVGQKSIGAELQALCYLRRQRARPQSIPKEMSYVSAVLRIQAGGVEPFRCRMLLRYARFMSTLLDHSFFFREDLDAKAAFVTASTAIDTLHMICMPLPSKRQMLAVARATIPHSCVMCRLPCVHSPFVRSRGSGYLGEMDSRFNLTSSFRTQAPILALCG
jgi:hypothetical protein